MGAMNFRNERNVLDLNNLHIAFIAKIHSVHCG